MLHRNTSWSSIYLFNRGFMFSFAFIGDMDFSFHWQLQHQASEDLNLRRCFSLGNYRGRSWANDT